MEIRNIFVYARAGEREQPSLFFFASGEREQRWFFLFASAGPCSPAPAPACLISSLGVAGEFEEQRTGAAHD
jgi:hypothetical protein